MSRELDALDRRLLEFLGDDARTSNRRIAAALDVTEGTVRSRIKRLEEQGVIRITAITNTECLQHHALVYLWVDVRRSEQTDAVAAQLSAMPEIGFVGRMMGRGDILAITMVQDNRQLAGFLQRRIHGIDGVAAVRCSMGVDFRKHDYRVSRIVQGDR